MGVLLRTYHFSLSLDKTIRLFVKNIGFLLIINKDLLNYKIFLRFEYNLSCRNSLYEY